MKLRNKKTGEIVEYINFKAGGKQILFYVFDTAKHYCYNSLAELNEEWEDYEEPKEYWFIDIRYPKVEPKKDINLSNSMRKRLKEIGNYFETKEEAEKAVAKLKAWKRLKDKGFRFAGWDMRNGDGGYEPSIGFELNGVTDVLEKDEIAQEIVQDLDLLFGDEE